MFTLEPGSSVEALEVNLTEFDKEAENKAQEPAQPAERQLEQLITAVGALQEQFREKIAVDAHKNALFDKMHQELIRHQNGILNKIVESMALDIIQLVDFAKRSLCTYEEKEASEDSYKRLLGVVRGIAEDLGDILYRQSIEPYQVEGETVDVRRQKIIQTVETDDQAKDNLVAIRVAEGYERDGRIIRPERIKIYKYSPEKSKEA